MADIKASSLGGIPFGNTANRPTVATGQPYFNGQTARLEIYTSLGAWENIVQEVPSVTSISGNYSESANSGTITINGTNFVNGAYATAIGSDGIQVNAASTTFNSLVQLTAVFTGLSNTQEPYDIKVTNPSNLFGQASDLLYVNASPVWVTSSGTLGTFLEQVSISVSATATDSDSTISYALASGSTLPSGITLNSSTGAISGTLPDIASDTTYTFTINASDGVNSVVSRTFSMTSVILFTAEYLIVGAGGNGGFDTGVGATAGGGGAGGYLSGSKSFTKTSTTSISVGAAPAASTSGTGYMGQNSYIDNLIAYAGGAGQYYGNNPLNYYPATSGGSGGGGGYTQRTGGAGTSGQGNAGGNGIDNSNALYTGGGGGGAGGAGVTPTTNGIAGAGGPGLSNSITGTAVIYAAGGGGAIGGGTGTGGAGGSSGVGGVGGSGNNLAAGDAVANTGSGGGGRMGSSSPSGGNGSAGVVIVAYLNTYPALTIPGTLTYNQPSRSGYRVYRFTAGTGNVTF